MAEGQNVGSISFSIDIDNKKKIKSVIEKTMRGAEKEVSTSAQKMKTSIDTNSSKAAASMSKIGTAASSISGKIKGIGLALAAAFSVKKMVDFAKSSIDLGSDLAEVQNVVDVTFGDMTDKVNAFATAAMKTSGLSETVAKKYIGNFGAMAKAFGYTTEQSFAMSKSLTELSGDVASFYNLSTDEAFTKLKSVFTGETESLKQLGVVMTQSALDSFALANGFGKTTSAMTEQEKVMVRYQFVMNQLQGAQGDFVRTSGGWANQMRVLNLQFQAFKANIGQGLIAALTPLLKNLNILMEKLVHLSAVFKALMEQLYGKPSEGSAGAAVKVAAESMGNLDDNTQAVNTGLTKTAKKLKSLMGFDKLNILNPKDSGIDEGLIDTSDISSMVNGFEGLDTSSNAFSDALEVSQEEIDKMKAALKKVLKYAKAIGVAFAAWKIGSFLKNIIGLKDNLLGLGVALTTVGTALEAHGLYTGWTEGFDVPSFIESLSGSGLLIAGAATIGQKFGSAMLGGGIGAVIAGIPMYIVGVKDALMNGLNWLNGILIPAGSTMAGAGIGAIIGSLGGPIGTGVGALIGLIIGMITDLIIFLVQNWEDVSAFLSDGLYAFCDAVTYIEEEIWNGIKAFFKTVKDGWHTIWIWVKNTFVNLGTNIKATWTSMTSWFGEKLTGFKNGFVDAFTFIRDKIVSIFSSIGDILKAPINGIIDMVNFLIRKLNDSISISVPDWVPGIGGESWGFSLPEIPHLATGGYVKPNNPRLAVVGDNRREGEIIAPESKIAEAVMTGLSPLMSMLSGSMQRQTTAATTGDIIIPVYIGNDLLDQYIINANNRNVYRSGR